MCQEAPLPVITIFRIGNPNLPFEKLFSTSFLVSALNITVLFCNLNIGSSSPLLFCPKSLRHRGLFHTTVDITKDQRRFPIANEVAPVRRDFLCGIVRRWTHASFSEMPTHLPLGAAVPLQQLEVIQGTLELAEGAHAPVLRDAVRVVALHTVQPAGFARDQFQVAAALAAPGHNIHGMLSLRSCERLWRKILTVNAPQF